MSSYYPVNWGPLATNVIDKIGNTHLVTKSGLKVTIRRVNMDRDFQIEIEKSGIFSTDNNISASAYLNAWEVGFDGKDGQ